MPLHVVQLLALAIPPHCHAELPPSETHHPAMADKSSSFTALLTSALCLSDDMLVGRKGRREGGRERGEGRRGREEGKPILNSYMM